jgi:L-aminopeptidase/D-esterase-like protein
MSAFPSGFSIGHWTDPAALTGCTVILCPPHTMGGCEVRGASPGSRETDLLASERTMQEVHALLLAGGSAFGLAAADGVMRFLEEQGKGYATPWARVPIVPAAVVFDLNIGSPSVRPGPEAGHAACLAARPDDFRQGNVGAGTGASVGKWAGGEGRMKGGLGIASMTVRGFTVSAVAVVNAVGDVLDSAGRVIAGAMEKEGGWKADRDPLRTFVRPVPLRNTNTTLTAVLTDARLDKVDANRVARRAHNGYARAVRPVHTSYDGDAVFVLSAGGADAPLDLVAEAAAEVTEQAIRNGVLQAEGAAGVPAVRDLRHP